MGYKHGGKCIVIKEYEFYNLKIGDVYNVIKHDNGDFMAIINKQEFWLTEYDHFWPWKHFKPYEEFQIKTEEDYYTWLARR